MDFFPNQDFSFQLDQEDPLASYRNQFIVDDPDLIYLDGNSLGRLPKAAIEHANQLLRKNGAGT